MSPSTRSVGRIVRTVAHLEPAQVIHRLRAQARRRVVGRQPDRVAARWRVDTRSARALPAKFSAIDSIHLADRWDPAEIAAGSLDLLNDRRDLGGTIDWNPPEVSQLWLFHLHYWEWAWSLAAAPDRATAQATFAHHWDGWDEATTFGKWNAWAPYPASLRAWVLVNTYAQLAEGTEMAQRLIEAIGLHAGFLEHNVELDVGGNHLIKNIKGILGCAVFLDDQRLVDVALGHLHREIQTQVLADGGHYELSPSYHCQVLVDLLDMSRLLAAAGRPAVPALDDAVGRMRTWLGQMVMPDGSLPLFNDAEPVEPKLLTQLEPHPASNDPLTVLADSGYAIVRQGPFHLVVDVGQPGPPSPPGHIHADCLSFALHVNGEPVIVDTGTSEYGSGPRRAHERSTAAHNTVEVDLTDQTEVFGAFRAGRRARATLETAALAGDGTVTVTASHDGYRHLDGRPVHRRTWTVDGSAIQIHDRIEGEGDHEVVARLHTPGGEDGLGPSRIGPLTVECTGPGSGRMETSVEQCELAVGFGHLEPGQVLVMATGGELPLTLHTHLRFDPQVRPHGADGNPEIRPHA